MKRRQPIFSSFLVLLAGFCLAVASAQPARAQDNSQDSQSDYSHARIVRLSFVIGDVQYQQGDEDWQTAPVNLPLQEGFRLATTDGRAEVEFESGLVVRLAENSGIEFTKLALENGGRITQLTLTDGSIRITANLPGQDRFSVSAPNLQMTLPHSARLRMDTAQGDTWVSVLKGDVQVSTSAGDTRVTDGHTLHMAASNGDQISIEDNAAPDDFDRWGDDRDRIIEQGNTQELQYLPTSAPDYVDYNYGLSDLSSYGHWTFIAGYGYGWQPYGVPIHWTPFGDGCWDFFGGGFGWTWVSFEPWGWLPYHTGHWFFSPVFGWLWEPGPFRMWDPAPVQWLRVGNQLGWAPRGSIGDRGEPAVHGVVTGVRDPRGIIRPGGNGPVMPVGNLKIAKGTPPEPIVHPRTVIVGNPVRGAPTRPVVARPSNHSLVFDPATRTYINEKPPVNGAPVNPIGTPIQTERNFPVRPTHPAGVTPQPTPPGRVNGTQPTPTRTPVQTSRPLPTPSPATVVTMPRYNPPPTPRPTYTPPPAQPQPRYAPPVQQQSQPHYSPPPSPPPAPVQHYSPPPPPPPPPSHSGSGGSSSGGHTGGGSSTGHH